MVLPKNVKLIYFLAILVAASIPGLIGPFLNISQWSGPSIPLQDLLQSGIPSVIISVYVGYRMIFLKLISKDKNETLIGNSLKNFIMLFIACLSGWIICQELSLVIYKALGMQNAEVHGWFDGLIGLPILLWLSILPCLIIAIIASLVSFVIINKGTFIK